MDKIVIISGYNNILKIPKKSKKKTEKEQKRSKIPQKDQKKSVF